MDGRVSSCRGKFSGPGTIGFCSKSVTHWIARRLHDFLQDSPCTSHRVGSSLVWKPHVLPPKGQGMKPMPASAKFSLARSTLASSTASCYLARPLPSIAAASSVPSLSSHCPPSCLGSRPRLSVNGLSPSITGFSQPRYSSSSSSSTTAPPPTRSQQPHKMAPKNKFELKTPKGTKDCEFCPSVIHARANRKS